MQVNAIQMLCNLWIVLSHSYKWQYLFSNATLQKTTLLPTSLEMPIYLYAKVLLLPLHSTPHCAFFICLCAVFHSAPQLAECLEEAGMNIFILTMMTGVLSIIMEV